MFQKALEIQIQSAELSTDRKLFGNEGGMVTVKADFHVTFANIEDIQNTFCL